MNTGRAVRIVGYIGTALLLGFGLAVACTASALAQTVVGGEQRPQVVVDSGVLDRLGPAPTLPDLLLGRQPMSPPGAPVKLHRPHARAQAAAKPRAKPQLAAGETPAAEPKKAAKPPKSTKLAQAESAPQPPPKAKPAAAAKTLVSSLEAPPRPPNADMPKPTGASGPAQTPPPSPAKAPAATPTTSAPAANPAPGVAQTPPPSKTAAQAENRTSAAPATQMVASATPTPPPAPPKQLVTAGEAGANPPPATSQQALLTPPPATAAPPSHANGALSIPFAKDTADLTDAARGALTDLAKRAVTDQSIQLQVLAYASGDEENSSKARRLSLSRALAVRSFLIDQGVHSTRIEVRALGNKVPEGPADRVDLVEEKR